jgi:hypothetical protein
MLAGGLSIFVLIILCLFSSYGRSELIVHEFMVLTIALNGTHFLASYRLLYSPRSFALSYPWASVIMPAIFWYGAQRRFYCVPTIRHGLR